MSAASASAFLDTFQYQLESNFMVMAALTLVCYEYLSACEHEYSVFWRRKKTNSAWLFMVNRYLTLVMVAVYISPTSDNPKVSIPCMLVDIAECNKPIAILEVAVQIAPGVVAAVFTALRVHALLNNNWHVSVPILFLGLVPIIINGYVNATSTPVYVEFPVLGPYCYALPNVSEAIGLFIASHLSVVVADSMALVVTITKTWRQARELSRLKFHGSLSGVILRDGSIYFVILLLVNIVVLLLENLPHLSNYRSASLLVSILQPILISRFLTNLRRLDAHDNASAAAENLSQFSAPNFRFPTLQSVTGDLGQPLDHDARPSWEDEDRDAEDHRHDSVAVHEFSNGSAAGPSSSRGRENGDVGPQTSKEVRSSVCVNNADLV
ncbi:hypothetical protein NM688_g1289 [Phlebia brevispora]|uniref:Uncharacterized protein n=1 Tax=Phlebia brevispora TaxID=194682 RepID=A0ACC1TCK3_9APHY|nr:hypothetical protein NM688_g1289 [Phlebia brevispora]